MKSDGIVTEYAYNAANQLMSAGGRDFTYDGAGNVIAITSMEEQSYYKYDGANRLTGVTYDDDTYAAYSYDAFGRMVSREVGEYAPEDIKNFNSSDYLGQSTVLHKVYSEHGSPMNEYYQAGGEVVAQKMFGNKGRISPAKEATLDTNGGLMYYEYDGLGTVTALRNRHGDTIEDYRYDAFGNLQTGITSPYNLKGYTGHLYDDKSSLVFMNARWYNPSVGRFMSEDTYRGDPAIPQSLNQYAYVMNNPVNFVDPTGNIPLYSRDYLESKTRDYLVSLEAKMGEYWWEDYDEFIETGVWTEKQNIAHANAELIREVRPYIFEKIDHYESWSGWNLEGKDVHPDRIVYTYGATKTITDVYQNDFETKTDKTYEYYTQTHVESAAQVAANNQSTIESDYGVVNSDWNNNPSMKLVRTERRTIHDYDNTLVKSTQTLTTDSNHTNVNKDVLIGEIGKGGVGEGNGQTEQYIYVDTIREKLIDDGFSGPTEYSVYDLNEKIMDGASSVIQDFMVGLSFEAAKSFGLKVVA